MSQTNTMGLPITDSDTLTLIDSTHGERGADLLPICLFLCSIGMARVFNVRTTMAASRQTMIEALRLPELDAGFHFLYELKFEEAHAQFVFRQKSHSEDNLGSAAEAASYLFEECYREGALTSEFFLDNKRFLGKIPLKPDPKIRAAFFAAEKRAQELAQLRLKTDPEDTNALFAMALSLGMQADCASLIDKKQLESLKMIGEADKYAKKLLVILPDAADAYLGLGMANYVIGSLRGFKKFLLAFAGIRGDRKTGIQQLQIAADYGHYLRPFAKILLALAALREKQTEVARNQLKELVAEFPENPLLANELAKLNVSCRAISPIVRLFRAESVAATRRLGADVSEATRRALQFLRICRSLSDSEISLRSRYIFVRFCTAHSQTTC